jgi:hypothetical protein
MTQHPFCTDLAAFCAVQPTQEEVSALLAKLGFHLVFQMDEQRSDRLLLPPLPAQYHFQDATKTEVVYLAGRDYALYEDGARDFPPHASRFWLTCGADQQKFQTTQAMLTLQWGLVWQPVNDVEESDSEDEMQHQQVA